MSPATTTVDLLSHYASDHRDPRNITTHFVGVPLMWLGLTVLLKRVELYELSAAWLVFAGSVLWCFHRRGPLVLSLAVTAALGLVVAVAHAVATGAMGHWLAWGLGAFGVGWLAQTLGHYYEGNKPTLSDHLTELLVGPVFLTAEVLFGLGWNPSLRTQIEQRAGPTCLRDLAHPA